MKTRTYINGHKTNWSVTFKINVKEERLREFYRKMNRKLAGQRYVDMNPSTQVNYKNERNK